LAQPVPRYLRRPFERAASRPPPDRALATCSLVSLAAPRDLAGVGALGNRSWAGRNRVHSAPALAPRAEIEAPCTVPAELSFLLRTGRGPATRRRLSLLADRISQCTSCALFSPHYLGFPPDVRACAAGATIAAPADRGTPAPVSRGRRLGPPVGSSGTRRCGVLFKSFRAAGRRGVCSGHEGRRPKRIGRPAPGALELRAAT